MAKTTKAGLVIGVSVGTVREARQIILAILGSAVEQETKREALRTLATLCNVSGTTVTGCHFSV